MTERALALNAYDPSLGFPALSAGSGVSRSNLYANPRIRFERLPQAERRRVEDIRRQHPRPRDISDTSYALWLAGVRPDLSEQDLALASGAMVRHFRRAKQEAEKARRPG